MLGKRLKLNIVDDDIWLYKNIQTNRNMLILMIFFISKIYKFKINILYLKIFVYYM